MRFFKIGADPEYGIGKIVDWQVVTTSAQHALGAKGMAQGIIGTDGHTETGELRPPPAHNVYLLLHYLGEALLKLHRYLEKDSLVIFASPRVGDLILGGHVHLSFTAATSHPGWDTLTNRLDYLLHPLEQWFPSTPLREHRNLSYPGNDVLRIPPTERPDLIHIEYRRPSSWLQHPAIAYAYLASAKLVALNINASSPPRSKENQPLFEIYQTRLSTLMNKNVSKDLHQLPQTLEFLAQNRQELINPTRPVDMEAWQKMILPGKETHP